MHGSPCYPYICGARPRASVCRLVVVCIYSHPRLFGVLSAIKLHRCIVYFVYEPKILVR